MRWMAIPLAWLLFASLLGSLVLAQYGADSSDGQGRSDNRLLRQLFDEDQGDRRSGSLDDDTFERDARRREQVLKELRAGRIETANDYYHAAMVFQHGLSADDIRLAFSLAWISAQMDSEDKGHALWLSAAAWDRIVLEQQMPQWYGTQYVSDGGDSDFRLYRVDENAVTDQERIRFHVPTLEEAKKRVEKLNRNPIEQCWRTVACAGRGDGAGFSWTVFAAALVMRRAKRHGE